MKNKSIRNIIIGTHVYCPYNTVLRFIHAPVMNNVSVVIEIEIKRRAFQNIVFSMRNNINNISSCAREKINFLRNHG